MSNHVLDLLNAYIDEELSTEERQRVEDHLLSCDRCKEEVEQFQQLKGWMSDIYTLEPVPNFLDENIMNEIRQMERAGRQLEYGLGFVGLSIILLFAFIHSYFNQGWKVIVAFYRVMHSFVQALPQLVGMPPVVTLSVLGGGLLIVVVTLPVLWKLLHSMVVEDRRGWQ